MHLTRALFEETPNAKLKPSVSTDTHLSESVIHDTLSACVRPGCPCTASYNGEPGFHCCRTCQQGQACSQNWHAHSAASPQQTEETVISQKTQVAPEATQTVRAKSLKHGEIGGAIGDDFVVITGNTTYADSVESYADIPDQQTFEPARACDVCKTLATAFGTNRDWDGGDVAEDREFLMCLECCREASLDDPSSPNHAAAVRSARTRQAKEEKRVTEESHLPEEPQSDELLSLRETIDAGLCRLTRRSNEMLSSAQQKISASSKVFKQMHCDTALEKGGVQTPISEDMGLTGIAERNDHDAELLLDCCSHINMIPDLTRARENLFQADMSAVSAAESAHQISEHSIPAADKEVPHIQGLNASETEVRNTEQPRFPAGDGNTQSLLFDCCSGGNLTPLESKDRFNDLMLNHLMQSTRSNLRSIDMSAAESARQQSDIPVAEKEVPCVQEPGVPEREVQATNGPTPPAVAVRVQHWKQGRWGSPEILTLDDSSTPEAPSGAVGSGAVPGEVLSGTSTPKSEDSASLEQRLLRFEQLADQNERQIKEMSVQLALREQECISLQDTKKALVEISKSLLRDLSEYAALPGLSKE